MCLRSFCGTIAENANTYAETYHNPGFEFPYIDTGAFLCKNPDISIESVQILNE